MSSHNDLTFFVTHAILGRLNSCCICGVFCPHERLCMSGSRSLSVIVPTLNEAGNMPALFRRLDKALLTAGIVYEVIVIDDHSSDATVSLVEKLSKKYPVRVFTKRGQRGKAYSLLEGFAQAHHHTVAIIDADLQYPPEALPEMMTRIQEGAGVVVANRVQQETSLIRRITSGAFAFIFARLLHGLSCDVQSGLKVFRREILDVIEFHPTPWTFDLAFLTAAREAGYTIDTVDIRFAGRTSGQSKVNVVAASLEIGWHALKLKFARRHPRQHLAQDSHSMQGAGVHYRGQHFVTHTTLPHQVSALVTFTRWQRWAMVIIGAGLLLGLGLAPMGTAKTVIAVLSIIYFLDVLYNLFLVRRSLHTPPEIHYTERQLKAINDAELPIYTILCPLYREAHVLPGFLDAIAKIDWPKDRLEVQLLLEENDPETIAAAQALQPPPYVRIVVVPHSLPKTKPKACNYGLTVATGAFLVIYDAEDIPDPLQLKKAYLGFQNVGPDVKCLQAKLNYYNPRQNLLTRLFTAEYSLWFDVMLTGLQSMKTYIPLGGTSNHFRTADLRNLQGWDPFNVTEDCDLGIRLFKQGYTTAVIDSTTFEEANSRLGNWLRQRSRWIKGYMQTYLVHMRRPREFSAGGVTHAFSFQLIVGGKVAFAMINPILWAATILYFVARASVGPTIEALYPPAVFTMAGVSLIFGNFLCLYYYMIGCAKRGQWGLMKYVFLVPFYWLATSVASYVAFVELLVKPHYWQKTNHGLHLQPAAIPQSKAASPRRLPTVVSRLIDLIPHQLRQQIGAPGGALIVVMMASNFLNLTFNAFLGRALTFEDLGIMTLMNTIWYLCSVFVNGVGTTINEQTAYLAAQSKAGAAQRLLHGVRTKAFLITLAISVVWVSSIPLLMNFFNLSNSLPFLLFTPVFAFGLQSATNRGYLNGRFRWRAVAVLLLVETLSKFGLAVLFVMAGASSLAFTAIPLSIIIVSIASFIVTPRVTTTSPIAPVAFPGRFYSAALAASISSVVFLSFDVLLVKHFLDPVASGQYALLALVGKMVYFFGSLPTVFMISLVRRLEGQGKSTNWVFKNIFSVSMALVVLGFIGVGLFGGWVVPLLFGSKAAAITSLLIPYVGALACFTLSTVIVSYRLAKQQYVFPIISFVVAVFMAIGIWRWHSSLEQIVDVIFDVSSTGFGILLVLHYVVPNIKTLLSNVRDFIDVFLPVPDCGPKVPGRQRILIFNWRDTKHVFAGGAEVYVHEIAKHWVEEGHQVMLFAGNDGQSSRNETVDGVHVIRRGGFYFVYIWAALYYAVQLRRCDFDVIIDCQNGIPFFTPLYTRRPVYCLMHHVHQEVFTRSLPVVLAWLARTLENRLMPFVYRRVPFITVSESSKQDILKLGLARAGIDIVHPGADLHELVPGKKDQTPMVLYLGRLKAYKSIDVLIRAFAQVVAHLPEARLVIAGTGEKELSLRQLVTALHLDSHVTFVGKVSDAEKVSLMQRAWLFVNPSFMEGWGITTIEANACATPVIAANVPGLRDSVRNPYTGYLVEHGNVPKFAEGILQILSNTHLRKKMSQDATTWAKKFDWLHSSRLFLAIIHQDSAKS